MGQTRRECLTCGLQHSLNSPDIHDRDRGEPLCIKCDSPLFSLSDGSRMTVDIAHQRETVSEALRKLEHSLQQVWQRRYAEHLRVIVGGGLIRDAVLAELEYKKSRGTVLDFYDENRGTVLVRIR